MEILRLSDTPLSDAVARAAAVLRDGGIVLYPTDTLYGLAADVTSEDAVRRLRLLKDRDVANLFSMIVPDMATLSEYAHTTPLSVTIAERYLPGPLTLVLASRSPLPTNTSHDGTIALRIPDHPFCLALARAFDKPYTATSANISGLPTHARIPDICTQFGDRASRIDLAIDAGELPPSPPSTIVDARGEEPIILRAGALTIEL